MKVYISNIGIWDDIIDVKVWKSEGDANLYTANRCKELKDEDPKRYQWSLWSDVEGPFDVLEGNTV